MIRSIAIPLMALAMASGPSLALAQPAAPPAGPPGDFQAKYLARMMAADANHDGRISLDEWQAWRTAHPGRGGGQHGDPAARFRRMDVNHDGYLSPDEIRAGAAKAYERRQERGAGGPAE